MNKLLIFSIILFFSCTNIPQNKEKSTKPQPSTAEDFGMSSEVLSRMVKMVKETKINVNTILINRNHKTVFEANFYPQKEDGLHDIASISKSITSLIIGIAINEGLIKNERQKIIDIFPDKTSLFDSEAKKSLTIDQLLSMTSGICSDNSEGEILRDAMKNSEDPLSLILKGSLKDSSSKQFTYCSAGVQILSMIISKTSGMSLEDYTVKKLFKPLNITRYKFGTDLNGDTNASGDIFLTAKELSKIGELILNNGVYEGKQIVPKEWIRKSTSTQIKINQKETYGFLWWLRDDLGGIIDAQGRGGQRLTIVPEKKLVVVMLGAGFNTDKIGEYIVESLKSDSKIKKDKNGEKLLKKELESIKRPFNVIAQKPIPEFANEVYGKKFTFQKNKFGFTYFILNANSIDSSKFILGINEKGSGTTKRERNVPLGLNGYYKISNETRFNTPMAARAEWFDKHSISIDYNEFSNDHKFNFTIEFKDKKATFIIKDEAEDIGIIKLTAESE